MARALTTSRCLIWLACMAGPCAALALGPGAPFTPPVVTVADTTDPALASPITQGLSGIKLGRRPQALIDGVWVLQGDAVRDGAVLTAIGRRSVQLRHADGTLEQLQMSPGVEINRSSRRAHATTPSRMP